jgi:hypothetical protein
VAYSKFLVASLLVALSSQTLAFPIVRIVTTNHILFKEGPKWVAIPRATGENSMFRQSHLATLTLTGASVAAVARSGGIAEFKYNPVPVDPQWILRNQYKSVITEPVILLELSK